MFSVLEACVGEPLVWRHPPLAGQRHPEEGAVSTNGASDSGTGTHPFRSPQRLVVIGAPGSGKTMLASEISRRLALPHVELDAFHWEPNWTEAPLERFRRRVEAALWRDHWVVDGYYLKVQDLIWPRAQVVVWLDYPLLLKMRRLVWRTLRRTLAR